MSRPLKILIVAYFYPPQNITGARRPAALAKWLGRRGHEATVLTSRQAGSGPDPAGARITRTRDLLATRLNWRGDSLKVVTGASDATWTPGANFWGAIVVPDVQLVSWLPFAVAAARRLQRRHGFDAVITTSPIDSAHLVGLALQRQGVPWIADLRDGWRFEAPREEWPLALQRRADDVLERLVVRRADAVVTVTEPLSADLRRRHGIAVETITNGFDPEDAPAAAAAPERAPRKRALVYTGGLGKERTLRPVLEALARMAEDDPGLADRVEVVLAGPQTAQEREVYATPAFAPFVRTLGFLDRPETVALQRSADVLLLVTSGSRTGEATGKLYEYLAAGRPILVLGAGSAAGTIVTEAGAGLAVPTHDAAAAETALRRLLDGDVPTPPGRRPRPVRLSGDRGALRAPDRLAELGVDRRPAARDRLRRQLVADRGRDRGAVVGAVAGEHPLHRRGERGGVAGRAEQPVARVDPAGQGARRRGDDRQAAGERLAHDDGERLVPARDDREGGLAHQRGDAFCGQRAVQHEPLAEAEGRSPRGEPFPLRPVAHEVEPERRTARGEQARGLDELGDALDRHEVGHGDDARRAARRRRAGREAVRVDRVGHDAEAPAEPLRGERVAQHVADGADEIRPRQRDPRDAEARAAHLAQRECGRVLGHDDGTARPPRPEQRGEAGTGLMRVEELGIEARAPQPPQRREHRPGRQRRPRHARHPAADAQDP